MGNGSKRLGNDEMTGKERDAETGLDCYEARYFSGAQGRFGIPDPFHVAGAQTPEEPDAFVSNPQRWNRYAQSTLMRSTTRSRRWIPMGT
jgi:RHS repeat-associated protein